MKRWISCVLVLLITLSVFTPLASAGVTLDSTAGYFGDVDGNSRVDATDALYTLRHTVGKMKLNNTQATAADVDINGKADANDALLMLKYSVNTLEAFKGGELFDSYTLSDYEYVDPDDSYVKYADNDFDYNTSLSVNGAYAEDKTADCSFVLDQTGLAAKTIYTVAASVVGDVDKARLIHSLQGLINRDFGRDSQHTSVVYVLKDTSDTNWLNYMMEEGSVYAGYTKVSLRTWDDFYATFEAQIKACGFILWDKNVPATSNVAATICGLDGYLPVLSGSALHTELVEKGVAEKQTLVGLFENGKKGQKITGTDLISTGSAKNDAYRWALEKYFDRCSSNYLAYILDGIVTIPNSGFDGSHCLSNHDYLIARRCFFFDLAPYAGEAACDDPAQEERLMYPCPECGDEGSYDFDAMLGDEDPVCAACGTTFVIDWNKVSGESLLRSQADVGLDAETLTMILARRYERANGAMGQLMGFPPWWAKYCDHKDNGSKPATWIEWLYCEIITCYNMAKEADAAEPSSMSNGSVYYKYVPKVASYDNKWEEYDAGVEFSDDTLYYTIYMGDYDSSAWLKDRVNTFFISNGRARGRVPTTWCFNPNLSYRVPMIFDYVYENKLENEFFAAGDSGAGYVIPAGLYGGTSLVYWGEERPAEYKNGDTMWAYYCKKFYDRFDMKATGFIINGSNALTTSILGTFNTFSTMGGLHNSRSAPLTQYKGVPYIYCNNGIDKSTDPTVLMNHAETVMEGYNFAAYRTICISPNDLYTIVKNFDEYAAGKEKKVQYVELYTLLDLARQSGQGEVIN